jgi:hypothetical protein
MKIKNVIITLISSYVFSTISAEASEVPKFIEVGKTYIPSQLTSTRFIVLEIDPSGWIKVRLSDKSIVWYNVNEICWLKEYKSE